MTKIPLESEENEQNLGDEKMLSEGQNDQNKLVDTTDSLEALSVFRGWKNLFFIIIFLCLLIIQACFWAFDLGMVKAKPAGPKSCITADQNIETSRSVLQAKQDTENVTQKAEDANQPEQKTAAEKESEEVEKVKDTVEKASEDANIAVEDKQEEIAETAKALAAEKKTEKEKKESKEGFIPFKINFEVYSIILKIVNFILIPAAVLYVLTLLFCLKLSFYGRLGGVNHISRAFFLSLIMLVILLPWQLLFGNFTCGYMFTPTDILNSYQNLAGIFSVGFLYLRYVGYWIIILLLLIFAQSRGGRWSRVILKRLEVV